MAIIVDKIQKRKDIALSCKELFIENGMQNITIAKIAKTAGVGKGTIYEYFENKEEIVFEIVNAMMYEYNQTKEQRLQKVNTTQEKIKVFFYFFYNKEEEDLRKIYKEFVSISLATPNSKMVAFQTACTRNYLTWFEKIIQEGINKKELIPSSIQLARGLFVLGEGMFISSEITNTIDNVEKEFDTFFDVLFQLIEVKK